jgi:hypothetical protein
VEENKKKLSVRKIYKEKYIIQLKEENGKPKKKKKIVKLNLIPHTKSSKFNNPPFENY